MPVKLPKIKLFPFFAHPDIIVIEN
jgi:hypothetical protein